MRCKILAPITGVLMLIATFGMAEAQNDKGRDAQKQGGRMSACRTDAATFCQNVEAGGGRRVACLQEHKAKLSPDCAQAVEARGQGGKRQAADTGAQAPAAKSPEAATVAPSPVPGAASGPAPGAASGRQKAASGEKRGGRMAACQTDRTTLCQGVEKGGGRIIQCLKQNRDKLSPACGEALSSMPERGRGKRADAGDEIITR